MEKDCSSDRGNTDSGCVVVLYVFVLDILMQLGESILPMKEDFIMVHMHHACSHCRLFIVTGCRWVCGQCKNFQLCDRCGSLSLAHLELIKTWQLSVWLFFFILSKTLNMIQTYNV